MRHSRLKQDIFRLQVTMDQPRFVQDRERIEQLGRKDAHEAGAQTSERVLLDKLVQIRREKLKDEAEMLAVDERIP